jgi:rRNA maturation endonuclease Nob1
MPQLTIVDADYAWSECERCGNTIKFGSGDRPGTVCPACGTNYLADRKSLKATATYDPSTRKNDE